MFGFESYILLMLNKQHVNEIANIVMSKNTNIPNDLDSAISSSRTVRIVGPGQCLVNLRDKSSWCLIGITRSMSYVVF